MMVSYKNFNALTIVLAIAAVLLLPMWPYSRWGYFPSMLVAAIVVFMIAIRRLARD